MADNFTFKDAAGSTRTAGSKYASGVDYPRHIIRNPDNSGDITPVASSQVPATLGQTTKANSLSVTVASDQEAISNKLAAATSGGCSTYRNIDIDETGVNIKNATGQVYAVYVFNAANATRYLKLYDKATAPTVGTDTPLLTIPVAAGAGISIAVPQGIVFASGIGIGAVTAVADNSTAAPSTNDVIVNVLYK